MKSLEIPQVAELGRRVSGFYDDFTEENTARWTTVATDSGGSVLQAESGGVVLLDASDGTVADNDEVYFHTAEIFKFVAGQPIELEAFIKFAEANTNDANIAFGLANAIAANHLQDNGAGPPADYVGAVFFKVDGGTTWTAEYSDSTTQKTQALDGTQPIIQGSNGSGQAQTAGGAFQRLRILWTPYTSTKADVAFFIDDVLVCKFKDQTYANATEMSVWFGVKNGDTNEETLRLDYCWAYQKRAAV